MNDFQKLAKIQKLDTIYSLPLLIIGQVIYTTNPLQSLRKDCSVEQSLSPFLNPLQLGVVVSPPSCRPYQGWEWVVRKSHKGATTRAPVHISLMATKTPMGKL